MKHRQGIINGIVAGILTAGVFLLFYLIDRALIFKAWVYWGSTVIYVIFMFRTLQRAGAPSFRSSLQEVFIVFIVANAIFYLFYYLLFSVFDPGLVDLQREILAADPRWQEGNSEADLSVTPGWTLFSFANSLVGGFLLTLIVCGIGRR